MIKKMMITVPKLSGRLKRRVYIYLPKSYRYDRDRRYPVIYMFDGQNLFYDSHASFGKSWGLKSYLDYTGTDVIIAAIDSNPSRNNGRLKELAPFDYDDPRAGFIRAKGDRTMKWVINELKAYVDDNFRTLPDRDNTYIAGSSMGGLLSIYGLLAYNDVFSRGAALSPSLWTDPEAVLGFLNEVELSDSTVLYMDYGSEEFSNHEGMDEMFVSATNILFDKGVFLTSRIVPYGTHSEECWEHQVPVFMNVLME